MNRDGIGNGVLRLFYPLLPFSSIFSPFLEVLLPFPALVSIARDGLGTALKRTKE